MQKIKSLILALFLFSFFFESNAQETKIGIIFDADTTLICQHVGFTIFSNSTNKLPLGIDMQQFIIDKLKDNLSKKYNIDCLSLPDSLKNIKMSFFESGISKKISTWFNRQKKYDYILFISNADIPSESGLIIPNKTSGIYSKPREAFLYTTIAMSVYSPSKEEFIYRGIAASGDWFPKLRDTKLPKNKKKIDSVLLESLKIKFENFLNERFDYYLLKSKLALN